MGCDNGDIDYECPLCGFLLTHPVWDVTEPSWESLDLLEISTHTSRVGCDTGWNWFPTRSKWISTHTSRVGCDFATGRITEEQYNISTHTSRVGCDPIWLGNMRDIRISTHTSRVGCDQNGIDFNLLKIISTHTSRVGCDIFIRCSLIAEYISTHTSRVGCDSNNKKGAENMSNFYSHIPCGMWLSRKYQAPFRKHFYSHIPCGMWPDCDTSAWCPFSFLLTHPVWDVTMPKTLE